MNMESIKSLWKPQAGSARAGVSWWDGKAEHFSKMELPTAESSISMRLIEQEGMAPRGCSVLDVGCGGGRFSFALEKQGAAVTATDFSANMIAKAKERAAQTGSRILFSCDDWRSLDPDNRGWRHKFDLVLANMTPAVCSAETFLKLSDVSSNWVLMVKPTRRDNSVLDALLKCVGAQPDTKALDETIIYAFALAWTAGYRPKLEYEEQVWENTQPLAEAIEEYTLRIASMNELTDDGRAKIKSCLEGIAEADGTIHETTHTTIAAMYWQVK